MKKKLLILAGSLLLLAAGAVFVATQNKNLTPEQALLLANVEALGDNEYENGTVMYYVCEYVGCCGGQKQCISGTFTVKGISISGTFYHN